MDWIQKYILEKFLCNYLKNIYYYFSDIVCEMDTLRTQKIRYLTGLFREMKLPMSISDRLRFIDNLMGVLPKDKQSKNVTEVYKSDKKKTRRF